MQKLLSYSIIKIDDSLKYPSINAYKTGYLINEIIPVSEIECEYYTRAVDNLLLHIKKISK